MSALFVSLEPSGSLAGLQERIDALPADRQKQLLDYLKSKFPLIRRTGPSNQRVRYQQDRSAWLEGVRNV